MKRKAIFLLYRTVEAHLLPAVLLYLILRVLRDRRYFGTIRQRFGELPALWQKTVPEAIWFHAVSVGEVLAAVPLLEEVRRRTPKTPLFLSTSTLAGRETADKRAAQLVDGIFYAPLDYVWCVRRVLRRIRPAVLVVLETEIWPNLLREAHRVGCGVAIVNGRISDRALPRYRRLRSLFAPALSFCDRIEAQSELMRQRYLQAGAPRDIMGVTGNLKYDFAPTPLPAGSPLHAFFNSQPLWIAASTSSDGAIDEEDLVIEAQRRLPGWRLIIAPRQPSRFEAVRRKLEASGLRFTQRSNFTDPLADVLLLDSIGELSGLFAHASVVFMGGTIASKGGHNILEPALFGKPVIAGPHLENFRDIEQHFETRQALLRAGDLATAVKAAAADPSLGLRARAAALEQQGAAKRNADTVMELYNSHYPCERRAQPMWMCLWLLSQVWRAGSARDRRRKRARQRRLPVPVASVGNVTVGGTGKTPVTIELLRNFSDPGLLMRGHGRDTSDIVLYLGEKLPIEVTGDEAQLYMDAVSVPIGIGSDRYETGAKLLQAAPAIQTLFLDDGFQHLQLAREFDLVLIDALRPFGGGHLLPLGRLREPLIGLGRAHAFLITRSDQAANTKAIERELRRHNADAPIFHARAVAKAWRNFAGESLPPESMRGQPAIAFCGLGNPESFWRTLQALGIEPLDRHNYGDHHRYPPTELRRLAQYAKDAGAEILLTTAKDAVNLCSGCDDLFHPLRVYWLEIAVEIDQRDRMIRLLEESVRAAHPRGMNVVEP